jgi:uncharacterized membrane protein SpoIIM required for sporulation
MKVVDLLESRRDQWRELEAGCGRLESGRRKSRQASEIARFAFLYRAACADLALADAYQLPPATVQYLHQLVGRAHNQMYRSRSFDVAHWSHEMLVALPRRLFRDNSLRLAFVIFWGMFLATMAVAYVSPDFAERLLGKEMITGMEQMYDSPLEDRDVDTGTGMSGFYLQHNAGIGLQCFAGGIFFGVGGILITISNAAILGAVFGHMLTVPQRENFYHFVTGHGPFELTAIVLAAGAGMRMGFSLIDTRGWRRGAALRLAAREAVPAICASIVLFGLAGLIEAFISPSPLPYWVKASVGIVTTLLLLAYFFVLGFPRRRKHATG